MENQFTPGVDIYRRIGIAFLASFAGFATVLAQPLQTRSGAAPSTELTSRQVEQISGATVARLEQVRALAAERNWEEAIEILQGFIAEDSSRVVDLGDGRLISLRAYCHLQLASMSAEALPAYRRLVDVQAERWYRDGLAERDEPLLRRVVDEFFCSSWGDDALFALGELALERADYPAARRYWDQISPLLLDPAGRSTWLALRDIDLNAYWPQIERRWAERPSPPEWLAYPSTELDLATVRARLIVVSIREGQLTRATLEIEVLRRFHPNAAGRLAGQQGPYVAMLEHMLALAYDWPAAPTNADWLTFAGEESRAPMVPKLGPITGPNWVKSVALAGGENGQTRSKRRVLLPVVEHAEQSSARGESGRPLSCFPVVANGLVLFSDSQRIQAVDLATGRVKFTSPEARGDEAYVTGTTVVHGVPRHTVTVNENVVYTRFGPPSTTQFGARHSVPTDRLVGLDLKRDGLMKFRARPEDGTWAFGGAPLSDGRHIFVSMRRGDIIPLLHVACFDAATGSPVWRTPIGSSGPLGSVSGEEATHNLLTLVGDRIYFNSNVGLVASLDTATGDICWLRRYDRLANQPLGVGSADRPSVGRDPSPCLYHDGLVFVAPADSLNIFSLDAFTGKMIWSTDRLPDGRHLLGTVRGNLIVGGNRLSAIDIQTGQLQFVWPESESAGIRGMGRGAIAGDEVYWPTRREIYVIHAVTGAQSRNPIPLGSISDCGANLAAAHGRLIVAGPDQLMAFGPALPVPPRLSNSKGNEPIATSDLLPAEF